MKSKLRMGSLSVMGLVLLLAFQNCSPVLMESKSDGLDKIGANGEIVPGELPEGESELPVAELPEENEPIRPVVQQPVVMAPVVQQPGQPVVMQPVVQQPVVQQPVVQQPIAQIPVRGGMDLPSKENEDMNLPQIEHSNGFTSISDSFLLACNRTINSINTIDGKSQIVLVNTELKSLTVLEQDSEIILVNSKLAKKATVQKGKIRVVTAADEIAMWNQRCQPAAGEAEGATGIFNTTVLMPSEVANMPKAAKIYQITGIASGVSIEGLVTDSFTATSMEPNVNIKMKVKDFTLTHLDKSKLELY